jgi:PAT family acetyl-CoA transporter-like MFS transporter 1
MQEYGMPKADITAISPLIMLVGFILPPMLSKYVPTKPLYIFVGGMGLKLFTSLLRWLVVVVTPHFYMHEDVSLWASTTFYGKLTATFLLHEIAGTSMFLGMMSFFAKISDPSIGGTYMTLLNTISNLGSIWPGSTALYILPRLTVATCHKEGITTAIESFHCNTKEAKDQCFQEGGTCNLRLDGYTVETMGALCIGVLWLLYMKKYILQMQNLHYSEWRLSSLNSQSRKA